MSSPPTEDMQSDSSEVASDLPDDLIQHTGTERSSIPYLQQLRNDAFIQKIEQYPNRLNLPLPTPPIKRSFVDFTTALAQSFLVAVYSPPSKSKPACLEEFHAFQQTLGLSIDASVPDNRSDINFVEVKRMVLMSLVRWSEVWKDPLPDCIPINASSRT
ncbi:hypothetical protein V5O48_014728 [Marasmius crinis-equi]|uniref:Uncharacterized protein n=1 Tax=Marasmius crinis-equi TaxID=585013 RepID=A0ABR3EWH6_9AGAR